MANAAVVRPAEVWVPLDVDETDYVQFDYSDMAEGDSIQSVVVTCEDLAAKDASASSRLSGAAQVNGLLVRQMVSGAVTGASYLFRCKATMSSTRVLVQAGTADGLRVGAA